MKSPSEKTIRNFVASGLAPACGLKSSAAAFFKLSLIPVNEDCGTSKCDVERDDSQRQFLAKHSVTMLEQCYGHSKQCRKNVALKIVVANRLV